MILERKKELCDQWTDSSTQLYVYIMHRVKKDVI
jgi:hypothetical protein